MHTALAYSQLLGGYKAGDSWRQKVYYRGTLLSKQRHWGKNTGALLSVCKDSANSILGHSRYIIVHSKHVIQEGWYVLLYCFIPKC